MQVKGKLITTNGGQIQQIFLHFLFLVKQTAVLKKLGQQANRSKDLLK